MRWGSYSRPGGMGSHFSPTESCCIFSSMRPVPSHRIGVLAIAALVVAACTRSAPTPVEIRAVNYAFGAPASLPPGPALFRLVNAGTVPHEVQLYAFKAGISADSGRRLLGAEHFPDSLADSSGAVLISAAGATAPEQVYVDLLAGRTYALVCQFRDTPKAPRHNRLGMFAVLHVTSGPRE